MAGVLRGVLRTRCLLRFLPCRHWGRAESVHRFQPREFQFQQVPHVWFANENVKNENGRQDVEDVGGDPKISRSADSERCHFHRPGDAHQNEEAENETEILFGVDTFDSKGRVSFGPVEDDGRHDEEGNITQDPKCHRSIQIDPGRCHPVKPAFDAVKLRRHNVSGQIVNIVIKDLTNTDDNQRNGPRINRIANKADAQLIVSCSRRGHLQIAEGPPNVETEDAQPGERR